MDEPSSAGQLSPAIRLAARAGFVALLLWADVARSDNLKIQNVSAAPRDAGTATVTFDVSWENSWRHGSFHDAAWVFFKVQPDKASEWQPVRLVADKVLNPAGYEHGKDGTPLEFVVPGGDDGFNGVFIRRGMAGKGPVANAKVTVVWNFTASKGVTRDVKVPILGFGIEMVYVAEGAFHLGSGGTELNRFHAGSGDAPAASPYRVTGIGAIPTGSQQGKLWATGITPEDGGEIPASFPNGYGAFYCMKHFITQGQYADFLNTLTDAEAGKRFYPDGQGRWINRSGEPSHFTYAASGRPPSQWYGGSLASGRDQPCPWLSWADGAALAAWAGLRPMTEFEYEKACRGPLMPVPKERGLSYFGVGDLNRGLAYERPVSAGSALGRRFAGTHGRGTTALPADWPVDVNAAVFRGDYLHLRRYSSVGHLGVAGRLNMLEVHADRKAHPLGGWRGARTAPAGDTAMTPVVARFEPNAVRTVSRMGGPIRTNTIPRGWGEPLANLSGPADLFPLHVRFTPVEYRRTLQKPWQGREDLDAQVYLGSDGEFLCVGAVVTDDRHFNTKSADGISNGDALQIGLLGGDGVHWKLGLALTDTGVAFHQWEGKGNALLKSVNCTVIRDEAGRTTRYEALLPLAVLGLKPGVEFGCNLMVIDHDDDDGQLHTLQLAGGMTPGPGPGGDKSRYPRFVLGP